jgi:hypothetical protein
LTPINEKIISASAFLSVLNAAVFSFFLKKFLDHTWMVQISDIRGMPLVIPTRTQAKALHELGENAIATKRLTFTGNLPPDDLVAYVRQLSRKLRSDAPSYLKPPAQQLLLDTATDCLNIIELAVNWEAEKLYGVEGLGPFDEF